VTKTTRRTTKTATKAPGVAQRLHAAAARLERQHAKPTKRAKWSEARHLAAIERNASRNLITRDPDRVTRAAASAPAGWGQVEGTPDAGLGRTYQEELREELLTVLVDKAVERMRAEQEPPSTFETRLSLKVADIGMAQERLAQAVKTLEATLDALTELGGSAKTVQPPDKSDRAVKPVSKEWRPWVLALLGEFDVFSAYATREQLTDRLTEYCEMERLDAARLARQQVASNHEVDERQAFLVDIAAGDQVTLSDGSSAKVLSVQRERYTVQVQDGRETVTREDIVAVTQQAGQRVVVTGVTPPVVRRRAKAKKR
jgi:preprotein translocase subunit YajC